jgi:hypothetical protein
MMMIGIPVTTPERSLVESVTETESLWPPWYLKKEITKPGDTTQYFKNKFRQCINSKTFNADFHNVSLATSFNTHSHHFV